MLRIRENKDEKQNLIALMEPIIVEMLGRRRSIKEEWKDK
jgi:hypothetical protein